MNVIVMNRAQASSYSYADKGIKTAMISITDVNKEDNDIKIDKDNVAFLLRRKFLDVVDPEDPNSITIEQAMEIAKFVMRHKKSVRQIIVHCEGGISRSAGVAAAILKYLNNNDSEIFDSPKYCPNILAYRRVLEAFYSLE